MDGRRFSAFELIHLHRVEEVVASPTEPWLAVVVARLDDDKSAYVSDLWRVSLDEAAPVQLTRGDCRDRSPRFDPEGRLYFLSNRNPRPGEAAEGDKDRAQVWRLGAGGGEPTPITDEPLGVEALRVGAGRLVVQAGRLPGVPEAEQRAEAAARKKHGPSARLYGRMPVRHWDHWLPDEAPQLFALELDGGGRVALCPEADRELRQGDFDLSADGRWVVAEWATPGADRIDDRGLRLFDLAGGAPRDLGGGAGFELHRPRFSPAADKIYAISEQRHGAERAPVAGVVELALDGAMRPLAPAHEWSPSELAVHPGGEALAVVADHQGDTPVFHLALATGAVTRLSAEAAGGSHASLGFASTGALVGLRHRILHPPEPFAAPFEIGATPRLLADLSGFTPEDGEALATIHRLAPTGSRGQPVDTRLLVPKGAEGPCPTLLWIHGGPIAAWGDGWHWRWNPLVMLDRGWAVALPNPTGSTGYGQETIDKIWGNSWGGDCYDDLMRVTDALEARPEVAADKIVAMGGSFGGYMSNWIGANTTRFRAIVTHASLYDLRAFYGATDYPPWFGFELGGAPWEAGTAVDRYSPHAGVTRWETPTLIIHGERDYRVPIGEGLALFEALQGNGVESQLLIFPDEGHWILRPRNAERWYNEVEAFIAAQLGEAPSV